EGLAAILAKMLAKDPAKRFQTPAEAAAALKTLIPSHVPPPAPEEMPQLCPAVTELLADAEVAHTDTMAIRDEPTNEPAVAAIGAAPGSRPQPFGPARAAAGGVLTAP